MDSLTPAQRSERMSRIKGSGTGPEVRLAAELKKTRFKFTLNDSSLPGKPDFVFPRYKVAVFVHGCFWHGHVCQKGRIPKTNSDFWHNKILRNRKRDARVIRELRTRGWSVLTVWECKIKTSDACSNEALRVLRWLRKKMAILSQLRKDTPVMENSKELPITLQDQSLNSFYRLRIP